MKYQLITTGDRRPIVEVVFEDERYALFGEMLLAERGLLGEWQAALDAVLKHGAEKETFSGNAFSASVTAEVTEITNDISGEGAEAPTRELKQLVKAYRKQYGKLKH